MRILMTLLLFFGLASCTANEFDTSKVELTAEERNFVRKHALVTWAVEDNRPPFIFVQDGKINGLSAEYLKLISKKTGLIFRPVRTITFSSSIDLVKSEKIDIVTAIRPNRELSKEMNFSPPIAYSGGVFIFRKNVMPRSPLTAGIRKTSAAQAYLESRFPDMKLAFADDDEENLSLLQKGLVDGSVMDAATADFLIKKGNLQVRTARINFDYPMTLGYSNTQPILGSILAKAITAIPPKDKEMLRKKYLGGSE